MNLKILKGYSDNLMGVIYFFLVPALIAIAFITFLLGVYKYYILGADNETEREKGHQFILWGLIGFAVIVSVWGLVWMVIYTLGIGPMAAPPPPTI